MRSVIPAAVPLLLATALSGAASAQERSWTAEMAGGHAVYADESPEHFLAVGGRVHRYVTPRVSVGPELIVMAGRSDGVRDRNVMLTGGLVFDLRHDDGLAARRVIPFVAAGAGIGWARDVVPGGHYWGRQLEASAGGGVRVRVRRATASIEYRIGSELYQRVTGAVGFRW